MIHQRQTGSIISMAKGASVPFALDALQSRGRFFVEPGDELYGGQVIGEGLDPAWSPDGEYLYMRRDNAIRRLGIEDDSDSPVPDTEGGREPAVSPDGSQLAFSRTADGPIHDIWVVPALP